MPGAKDERSHLKRGGFSCFSDTPIGEATGGGVLMAAALSESLDKPFPWAVGFFFGNTELSLELWNVIAGISGFDDS